MERNKIFGDETADKYVVTLKKGKTFNKNKPGSVTLNGINNW